MNAASCAQEAGLYLPLEDDDGLLLPIGPPWALEAAAATRPAVAATAAAAGLPDLLGYATVEEVFLPSGVGVACCVQPAGGLCGDSSAEMQRLARTVMETQAESQAAQQQQLSPPPQLGAQVLGGDAGDDLDL
eukprot:COSAG06_NODE_12645_length_1348_cov_109.242594_1_plen_133_part_00